MSTTPGDYDARRGYTVPRGGTGQRRAALARVVVAPLADSAAKGGWTGRCGKGVMRILYRIRPEPAPPASDSGASCPRYSR